MTGLSQKQQNDIQEKIISPLLKGLIQKKIHYTGVLFVGLMITNDGPKVIEFNCRFGDPETQVLLPLLDEDLAELIFLAASNQLENKILKIKNHPGAAVHVVMASYGYPGTGGIKIRTGDIIKWDSGFYKNLEIEKKGKLFFAGVKEIDSQIVTAGGRVLGLTCLGKDRQEARENVYQNYKKIHFDGAQLRRDIGL